MKIEDAIKKANEICHCTYKWDCWSTNCENCGDYNASYEDVVEAFQKLKQEK